MVVLVGGENLSEKSQQICLLSDRERPLGHIDSLSLHGLTEGVLVRVVLELGLGDVLFDEDVRLPGRDDAGVVLQVGDGDGAELVVSVVAEVLRLGADDIQGGFVDGLADVFGELSDRSADLDLFLTRPVVVLGDLQLLEDFTRLLGDEGDSGDAALLGCMVDGDDWNPIQDGVDCLVEFRIHRMSWHSYFLDGHASPSL